MTVPTARPDKEWRNLFGVCAAIAEDFGFDPILLRIPFAVATIFWPVPVFATYFALGGVALLTRVLIPNRPVSDEPITVEADNDAAEVPLAKAA